MSYTKRMFWLVFFTFAMNISYSQTSTAVTPQDIKFCFKARLDLYLKRTYLDPKRHILLLGEVAFDDYASGGLEKWGSGISGYGKSLAPAYGQKVINNSVEFAAGAIIGDDARYRMSTSHGFMKRGLHAIGATFTATDKTGRIRPAYSRIVAISGALLISNQWRPRPLTGLSLGDALIFNVTDMAQDNLLTEFTPELKRLGNKIWHKVHRAKMPVHP